MLASNKKQFAKGIAPKLAQRFLTCFVFSIFLLLVSDLCAQTKLSDKDLLEQTIHFQIEGGFRFDSIARDLFSKEIQQAKIVAIAELHRSSEMSRFTAALIKLASLNDYENIALEMGPISAKYAELIFKKSRRIAHVSKKINTVYGIKSQGRGPLVFVDKVEDQWFLQALKDSDFKLWGLDQEYALSYEMHLDSLYAMLEVPTPRITQHYQNLKLVIRDGGHQSFSKGKSEFNCNIIQNNRLLEFFTYFDGNEAAKKVIDAVKTSWEIYCLDERGKNAKQLRADYMKSNFDSLWSRIIGQDQRGKLLLKMGSAHLSRVKSPMGIEDLGKHITEEVIGLPEDFLVIKHLSRFTNGNDLLAENNLEPLARFLALGQQDQWTLISLRPLRAMLKAGTIVAEEAIAFEINNYDYILIPPDDKESGMLFH
ncbi:MAG: hypothetical protein ACJA0X_002177 [Cyclobacteriaceae bacterium]|jgi:hypothetical protein